MEARSEIGRLVQKRRELDKPAVIAQEALNLPAFIFQVVYRRADKDPLEYYFRSGSLTGHGDYPISLTLLNHGSNPNRSLASITRGALAANDRQRNESGRAQDRLAHLSARGDGSMPGVRGGREGPAAVTPSPSAPLAFCRVRALSRLGLQVAWVTAELSPVRAKGRPRLKW